MSTKSDCNIVGKLDSVKEGTANHGRTTQLDNNYRLQYLISYR